MKNLNKKIIKVEIISFNDEITEDEALLNYAVGHMMGGFEGMVQASILNDSYQPNTTFLITYNDGTCETKTVVNNSFEFDSLIKYL